MKWICLIFINLVFACCGKEGMPGTYVRYSENQLDEDSFTRVYDTLVIAVQGHPSRKIYDIIRRYGTLKIIDGKILPVEYKIRRWTGTLEEQSQTIIVFGQARLISFYPKNNSLKLGSTEYFKIKRK
jgi:hypothetical protein